MQCNQVFISTSQRSSCVPLRKFGNPSSKKFWIVTWLSLRPPLAPRVCQEHFLLLVHLRYCTSRNNVNWQLSKQGIRWSVSRDHIVELDFFEVNRCPGTGFRADRWLKPCCYPRGRVVRTKAKFPSEITPGTLLTFLPRNSLNNRLFESPWYIAYITSTILEKLGTLYLIVSF